ncbi:MAG TPA: serine/threonine-protein kinase, partial [Byssovorax sp.]
MQLGDVVAARFTIEAVAGSGGMGVVYRARDAADGRLVALKLLRARVGEGDADDAEATRFDREARVLAGLAHPGIVGYLAHGTASTRQPFLAMEWLEGESLSARLRRGALSLVEAVSVARQVTAALAVAHRLGVVHRDVKPANLHLVDGSLDRVKVLDFGIARLGADPALTAT